MRVGKRSTLRSFMVVATRVCTILVACMQFTATSAEQAPDTKPDLSINSGVKPLGKRDIRDIRLSGWRKLCFEVSPAEKVCRTTNVGVMDTGQEMIRFDLIDAGAAEGRIQMLLPPGMYLRSGITLTVDQNEPLHLSYSWCLANACVAAGPATPRFVSDLRSGRVLTIEVVDPSFLTVSVAVPLDQFASVHGGPPTQLFDESLTLRN
ncbi:invasion associated locus B family protein [Bradyrhizobium sp. 1(2017)]|uniref:invasion associated locus B family protein n=1 Tax=Bradyrhizobium sp. 1(2017) TaxID=1404888 RepID=UPI00140F263E|nr:invasion associated locus B family protein [Bradyrhizobium sp. 1(2017)]QIO36938.1 invasion associated locus B family protein [Bradyrhizobium sp. 1(2017)]